MGFLIWLVTSFLIILVTSSAASAPARGCDRCVQQSKVTFFSNDDANSKGACGYGIQAARLKGGRFAGATHNIYNGGAACGACYQVRCRDKKICTDEGTTVIVTDLSNDYRTGFVLSKKAYNGMAKKGKILPGLINAEYQRVPCNYGHKNMDIRVHGSSNRQKNYLAIQLLFEGGQTTIMSIGLARTKSEIWVPVTRNYGAVWHASGVPQKGYYLKFKFEVKGRDGGNKVYTTKPFMPVNWINEEVYDSGIKITDTEPEYSCKPCSDVW